MTKVTFQEFKDLLPQICDEDTTLDPENWKPQNPLWGHCAVVSTVAQNLFGGRLLRASLEGTPFADMRSHYWNDLGDGEGVDFTAPQFGTLYPANLEAEERDRSYVLSYEETNKRYKLLAFRVAKALSNDNALFDDETYKQCFFAALDSPCQKMGFGCVVKYADRVVYEGNNKTVEPLRSMCEPECCRFSIKSRTESMLGACGHAEERALWNLISQGVWTGKCDFYVAGVRANGLPYIKEEIDFTCLRCALQLYNAGVSRIFVPVGNKWEAVSTEDAVVTAKEYALQNKNA